MARSERLTAARQLAARGLRLFPLKPGAKLPAVKGWQNAATTDPEQLARWFEKTAKNIGVSTDGLVVIDCDTKTDNGLANFIELAGGIEPDTLTVASPSGGRHFYFRGEPVANSVGKLARGIDVRSKGGLVVGPGSTTDKGTYTVVNDAPIQPIPEWLVATIAEKYTAAAPVAKLTLAVELDTDEACAEAYRYLADAPASIEGQGGNDNAYRIACHLKDVGLSEPIALEYMDTIGEWNARCSPPWDREELESIVAHAYSYGQNSAGSASAAADFDIITDWNPDGEAANDNPVPTGKLRFLTGVELTFAGKSPRRPIIKGLLAEGDIACIYGKPGAGKSLLAPYLGWMLAQGNPAFGKRTKPGPVFYVAAEDEWGMQGRLAALQKQFGDAPGFTLVGGVSNLAAKGSADLKELRAAIATQLPVLVIIDTVAMAFPGIDENSAEGMGRVVIVGRILAAYGCAVIFIHHDTKAAGDTPRGHSVFDGALDMKLKLTRSDRSGVISGALGKNRNGPLDWEPAFRIGVEGFGDDEDGDPITFAYAKPVAHREREESDNVPKGQQGALAILSEIGGVCGASFTAWRAACVDDVSKMSALEDRESRRKAFARVLQDLLQRGLIKKQGDRVWLIGAGSDFDLIENGPFPEDE